MKKIIFIDCFLVLIFLEISLMYWIKITYEDMLISQYREKIPVELKIGETILLDGDLLGMGWCGVGIFKLQKDIVNNLELYGLKALEGINRSRGSNNGKYLTYFEWNETPYIKTGDGMTLEDRWTAGFSCADDLVDLKINFYEILRSKGAYYSKSITSALIVVPEYELVAFVYFD